MNKKEYTEMLARELGSLPYNDVREITAEIEEHFNMAVESGKTEEQAADELGDVKELAKAYINCTPYKLPQVLQEKDTKKSSTGAKVFSVFICILAVPITACWVAFDIRIILDIIASSGAFIFRITRFDEYGAYQFAQLMNQIGTCFKVVFLGCLLYFGIKLLIVAGKKFIRLNRRLWTRGF